MKLSKSQLLQLKKLAPDAPKEFFEKLYEKFMLDGECLHQASTPIEELVRDNKSIYTEEYHPALIAETLKEHSEVRDFESFLQAFKEFIEEEDEDWDKDYDEDDEGNENDEDDEDDEKGTPGVGSGKELDIPLGDKAKVNINSIKKVFQEFISEVITKGKGRKKLSPAAHGKIFVETIGIADDITAVSEEYLSDPNFEQEFLHGEPIPIVETFIVSEPEIPKIVLMIDQSGSMYSKIGTIEITATQVALGIFQALFEQYRKGEIELVVQFFAENNKDRYEFLKSSSEDDVEYSYNCMFRSRGGGDTDISRCVHGIRQDAQLHKFPFKEGNYTTLIIMDGQDRVDNSYTPDTRSYIINTFGPYNMGAEEFALRSGGDYLTCRSEYDVIIVEKP